MRAPNNVFPVRRALLALVVVLSYASHAGSSDAAPAAKKPAPVTKSAPAPAKADVAPAIQKLKSGEEGQIRAALDELRIAGPSGAAATTAVVDVLTNGLNEQLTVQAIETLADLESPDASAILGQYASHRTIALRRAAVKALTRTKGPAAVTALRRALSDSDAQIRSNAAAGLGAMKSKDAVPDLFLALDHRVHEAAASIGQLCTPEQCEQLSAKLKKLPFDIVTSGLDQILFRPTTEIPDEAKIKVLVHLSQLGTGEANRFLKEVEKRLPKEASSRLRVAVEQAVKTTTGGSQ